MNFSSQNIYFSLFYAILTNLVLIPLPTQAQEINQIDLQDQINEQIISEQFDQLSLQIRDGADIEELISEELDQFSQPFINFAAIVKDGEEVIAIAGELETSLGELLQEVDVTLNLDVFDQVDPTDEAFNPNPALNIDNTAVGINFEVKEEDELDVAIETAIANLSDPPAPSEVISLVEAFLSDVREQAQPRVTVAAGKQDSGNSLNSALITEVELAPGQRFANFVADVEEDDAPMFIRLGVDAETGVLNELRLEREGEIIATDDENLNLEARVARAVANTNFENSSDVRSLVEAFVNRRSKAEGQARISGGSAIADHSADEEKQTVSAIIGEVQLGSRQLLGTMENNETQTLVIVTSQINNDIGGENIVGVDNLTFTYKIAEESAILESAIAEEVNELTFEETAGLISVIKAFTGNSRNNINLSNEPQLSNIALE